MIRRPPRSTQSRSSAASDVYKRQDLARVLELLQSPEHLHQVPGRVIAARRLAPSDQQVCAQACDGVVVRVWRDGMNVHTPPGDQGRHCLLYTSDAADDL